MGWVRTTARFFELWHINKSCVNNWCAEIRYRNFIFVLGERVTQPTQKKTNSANHWRVLFKHLLRIKKKNWVGICGHFRIFLFYFAQF